MGWEGVNKGEEAIEVAVIPERRRKKYQPKMIV